MSTIATLNVNLKARTAAFDRGLRKSQKRVQTFSKGITGAASSLLKFAAGFLAVRTAIRVISTAMGDIDRIAKLSDVLATSTEFLQVFGHVAKISGTSAEGFERSLSIMVRRLGEAQAGVGEATDGLKTLGLSADALVRAGTEEAFFRIGDAINRLPSAAARAQAAYELFGRQGMQLLKIFEGGRKAMEAAGKAAESVVKPFSRLDASQVEKANDAVTDMKASFGVISKLIAIDIAPALKMLAAKIGEAAGKGADAAKAQPGWLARAAGKLGDVVEGVPLAVENAAHLYTSAAVAISAQQVQFLDRIGLATDEMKERLRNNVRAVTDWKTKIDAALVAKSPSEIIAQNARDNALPKPGPGAEDALPARANQFLVEAKAADKLVAALNRIAQANKALDAQLARQQNVDKDAASRINQLTREFALLTGQATEKDFALFDLKNAGAMEEDIQRISRLMDMISGARARQGEAGRSRNPGQARAFESGRMRAAGLSVGADDGVKKENVKQTAIQESMRDILQRIEHGGGGLN